MSKYAENRITLRKALAAMCGHHIGPYDYVSYFLNESGESLIFWVERKTGSSYFTHNGNNWEKLPIDHPAILLRGAERAWFTACLAATDALSDKWAREANKKVTAIEILV
jgi:hypothetical protein